MNLINDAVTLVLRFIEPNELANNVYNVSKQWRTCAIRALPVSINHNRKKSIEKITFTILLNNHLVTSPALTHLNLYKLPLKNGHLKKLTVFCQLEWINLTGAKEITDISSVAELTHLTFIKLSYSGVKDLTPLSVLEQLRYLEFVKCKIEKKPEFRDGCKIVCDKTLPKPRSTPLSEVDFKKLLTEKAK